MKRASELLQIQNVFMPEPLHTKAEMKEFYVSSYRCAI